MIVHFTALASIAVIDDHVSFGRNQHSSVIQDHQFKLAVTWAFRKRIDRTLIHVFLKISFQFIRVRGIRHSCFYRVFADLDALLTLALRIKDLHHEILLAGHHIIIGSHNIQIIVFI